MCECECWDMLVGEWGWRHRSVCLMVLCGVMGLHAVMCPHTKVEESFTLHAVHDLLTSPPQFDHAQFPGVVPRTFVGAVLLWVVTVLPVRAVLLLSSDDAGVVDAATLLPAVQLLVRLSLAFLVAIPCTALLDACARRFSPRAAWLALTLMVAQFHLPFYASRTLPNTVALIPVLWALVLWLRDRPLPCCLVLLTSALIFRSELLILLLPLGLWEWVVSRRLSLFRCIWIGIPVAVSAVGLSVLVDSYFWGRWLWPEGEGLLFNVVANRSHEYGVMPWHWYMSSALSRALLASAVLFPMAPFLNRHTTKLVAVPLLFVALYSLLPHKELRFIIYVIPLLTIAAAVSLDTLLTWWYDGPTTNRGLLWRIRRAMVEILLLLALLLSVACVCFFLYVSMWNYPAGHALSHFNQLPEVRQGPFHVHIDADSAMTGISLFSHVWKHGRYSKDEHVAEEQWQQFSHLISSQPFIRGFHPIKSFDGFDHLNVHR